MVFERSFLCANMLMEMRYKTCCIFLVFMSTCIMTHAEGRHQHFFVSGQYHYQYIWKHFPGMGDEINNPARSFEINLGLKTSGTLFWHQLYNLPSYGIGFYYCDLNNPEIYGEVKSGFMFMEIPFSERRQRQGRLKVSLGLSFFNRYHDPVENPLNVNIGNRVNVHINLNYSLFFSLNDNLILAPGVSFTHFSNGAYKRPNRGFNLFDVNMALRFKTGSHLPGDFGQLRIQEEFTGVQQRLFLVFSFGFLQRYEGDPTYLARSLSLNHTIQTGFRGRWGIGTDIEFDDHTRKTIKETSDKPDYRDYVRLTAFASHEILFDRMSVLLNLGTYLHYKIRPDKMVFSRIGLRYSLGNNLNAQIALKAHGGRADHVQWGIGYAFGK